MKYIQWLGSVGNFESIESVNRAYTNALKFAALCA
jgi:hypothetical protein